MSTDTSRPVSGTNLTNRNGKVHAKLIPGPDRYVCRSGEQFGDPVSEGTTDSPVDCKRCLTRLAQRQSVDERPASRDDLENSSNRTAPD